MVHKFIPQIFGDTFKDFDKVFVGFDEQFDRMQKLHDDLTKNIPNYPPFNVRKVDDKHYTIEIAVAGFAEHEIDIEIDGGKLVVKGNTNSTEPEDNFIFKGIANRAFTRAWAVGDEYEVKDAEVFNGILKIALERLVPVTQAAKKVPVRKGSGKQVLNEGV